MFYKLNRFISTLNVILPLVGYQLITTLYSTQMSDSGDSRAITVPYRFFSLVICILTILLNSSQKTIVPKNVKALFFFIFLLAFRFFLDILGGEYSISSDLQSQTWSYILLMTLLPMYSVVKSFDKIDLNWLFGGILVLSAFVSLYIYYTVDEFQVTTNDRLEVGIALNSISVGRIGLISSALACFLLLKGHLKVVYKLLLVGVVMIGVTIMLRAGSRGPLLSLIAILLVFIYSNTKNKLTNLFFVLVFIALFSFSFDYILSFIADFAPALARRLTRDEGQLYDRMFYYEQAWNGFIQSPIWGKSLGIYRNNHLSYSHNILLDALLQWGIIGGAILIGIIVSTLKRISISIQERMEILWFSIILIILLMGLMVSGSMYSNPEFSIALVTFMLLFEKESKILKFNHG